METIVSKNEKCEVLYDDVNNIIIWKPLGKMSPQEFKDSFLPGLDKVEELYKSGITTNWLNEVEDLKVTTVDALNWVNSYVNTTVIKYGMKKVAFTNPKDVFGCSGVMLYVKFSNASNADLTIKRFENKELAMEWLMSS
jgi:hypothetical protein